MTARPYHFAAIVGGAIAGSVAAEILADHGIQVFVIEQNKRPRGRNARLSLVCHQNWPKTGQNQQTSKTEILLSDGWQRDLVGFCIR